MTKKQIILVIILVLLLVVIGTIGVLHFSKKDSKKEPIIKQEDIIVDYNYSIKETDSDLKKEVFNELKEILSASEVNYEEYSKKLAEIFVIDVYDLNSKINKYDVGGLEYVLEERKDMLKQVLQDSLYSNLKNNSNKNRQQELPVVDKVEIINSTTGSYSYKQKDYESYIFNIAIDYKKDLGYDKNVSVEIIKKDDKLFVVKINPN